MHTYYSDHQDALTIKVSDDDTYKSAVEKTLNIIRVLQLQSTPTAKKIMKAKWLMFVDDDTFINPGNLKTTLNKLDDSIVYGELHDYTIQEENGNPGAIDILEKYPSLTHGFHGGAGMLITPKILKKVNLDLWPSPNIIHGDVGFTLLLHLSGIKMKSLTGLNWNAPAYYGDGFEPNHHITFHYMDAEQMKDAWQISKSRKTPANNLMEANQ